MAGPEFQKLQLSVSVELESANPDIRRCDAIHLEGGDLREIENVPDICTIPRQSNCRMMVDAEIAHRMGVQLMAQQQKAESAEQNF